FAASSGGGAADGLAESCLVAFEPFERQLEFQEFGGQSHLGGGCHGALRGRVRRNRRILCEHRFVLLKSGRFQENIDRMASFQRLGKFRPPGAKLVATPPARKCAGPSATIVSLRPILFYTGAWRPARPAVDMTCR